MTWKDLKLDVEVPIPVPFGSSNNQRATTAVKVVETAELLTHHLDP
jgi:hypothetical protein